MSKEKMVALFNEKLSADKKLFVPYIMAGDGGLDILEERLEFLAESGADAVELGIPFSDPVADGPTIQDAGKRALENGTTLTAVLETLQKSSASRQIPVILMTYINPIYIYGMEKFAVDCKQAGVSGIIIPDLPLEEEALVADSLRANGIALIRLAALTSSKERLAKIAARTEGFLYAVSVKGTTGARTNHQDIVSTYLQELKNMANVPVLAGFGVSTSAQAKSLGVFCDGVIVGSKIVELFHQGKYDEIKHLIKTSAS